ncbi:sterile alpha motif domain-containing protein 1 [Tachysurus ichikawai]
MSEPRYREWILETIDSLRSRKARPDLERICRMVRRRHGSDPDRTRAELEKLIQEQTVLKVNYKGSVSYRNAAKVQRKCRRKVEQAGERTKHPALDNSSSSSNAKNDNISARSPADLEALELTPCRDPSPSSCSRSAKEKREEEDDGEEETAVLSPATGEISSFTSCNGRNSSCDTSSPAAGRVEGGEETRSVLGHGSSDLPESERRTCTSARNNKQHAPQLRAAKSSDKAVDLGDRLVAAVWSLSERNSRGHAPLGLKEILGYLGTQAAHADGEKLTRHRVKVVLEREIEKGRLRRTRLGHITVPGRRWGGSTGAAKASERLPVNTNSAPQDGRISKQKEIKEEESMEVECEEDGKMDEEAEPLTQLQPQYTEAEEETDVKIHSHAPLSTSVEVKACGSSVTHTPEITEEKLQPSLLSSPSKLVSTHQEAENEQCGTEVEMVVKGESIHSEILTQDQREPIPDQVHTFTQDEAVIASDGVITPPSIPIKNFCKAEVAVSSCLLTPSASPGAAEERGMNGGVFVKSESSITNLVNWTVADVASYFTEAGFPEQALAFRMQEIDGKSLLLMQRNDVLTGLSIRLGPALKIYERHVKVLQRTHFQDDEAFC